MLDLIIGIDSLSGLMLQFCLSVPHVFARLSLINKDQGTDRGSVLVSKDP